MESNRQDGNIRSVGDAEEVIFRRRLNSIIPPFLAGFVLLPMIPVLLVGPMKNDSVVYLIGKRSF